MNPLSVCQSDLPARLWPELVTGFFIQGTVEQSSNHLSMALQEL
jgi:hypothetical protein